MEELKIAGWALVIILTLVFFILSGLLSMTGKGSNDRSRNNRGPVRAVSDVERSESGGRRDESGSRSVNPCSEASRLREIESVLLRAGGWTDYKGAILNITRRCR